MWSSSSSSSSSSSVGRSVGVSRRLLLLFSFPLFYLVVFFNGKMWPGQTEIISSAGAGAAATTTTTHARFSSRCRHHVFFFAVVFLKLIIRWRRRPWPTKKHIRFVFCLTSSSSSTIAGRTATCMHAYACTTWLGKETEEVALFIFKKISCCFCWPNKYVRPHICDENSALL